MKIVRLSDGDINRLGCVMKRCRDTYRAATDERTGEVREMRTRNDPENTGTYQQVRGFDHPTHWHLPTLRSVAPKQSDRAESQTSRFR